MPRQAGSCLSCQTLGVANAVHARQVHIDMIFAVETEERTLYAFESEAQAIAACEGLDVEAAVWLFWANDGSPLEPMFTVPNKRGLFKVKSGTYHLVPSSEEHHAHLAEALEEIVDVPGSGVSLSSRQDA
jgi:hypothetical protein